MSPRSTSESDQARDGDDRREQGIRGAAAHAPGQPRRHPRQSPKYTCAGEHEASRCRLDRRSRRRPSRTSVPRGRIFFTRTTLVAVVRRLVSVAALVALDVAGLAFGSTSLSFCASSTTASGRCSGGFPGTRRRTGCPFLTVITVLVFWGGGLYAPARVAAGAGRSSSSLLLVTVITLAFGLGTGYHLTTFGLYADGVRAVSARRRRCAPSYDVLTRDVCRSPACGGARSSSARATLLELRRALGLGRGGIDYEFLGAIAPRRSSFDLPSLGAVDILPAILDRLHPDELIVSGVDLGDERSSISSSRRIGSA